MRHVVPIVMELSLEARRQRRRVRAERTWHAAVLMVGGPPVVTIVTWLLLAVLQANAVLDETLIWSVFLSAFVVAGFVTLMMVFYVPPWLSWASYALLATALIYSIQDFHGRQGAQLAMSEQDAGPQASASLTRP